ncbi:hypothetical protein ONE63_001805 [Megalurothrips usitatus]|uniref:G patch domain-containing protein 2-like n=1 Tax=Megalurothrips usitatus TaxID=439358 RepID=A0AAV7X9H9_9NEOP|nr:hypothetical protein ONE63_001805 [Megalurothrips usitatus]
MERVLQTVRMEALVNDLSHALEETTCSSVSRRRWGLCRRSRSTGNLHLALHATISDDSDSVSEALLNRERGHSSLHQSDSDDMSPARHEPRHFNLRTRHVLPHMPLESDSVNENFSPVRPSTRRRRKLKRMAIDVSEQAGASTSTGIPSGSHAVPVIPHFSCSLPSRPSGSVPSAGALFKKRRILRHQNRLKTELFLCGKRKRSLRDKSGGDCDVQMLEGVGSKSHKSKSRGRARVSVTDDCMELSGAEFTSSSPSVSSNESDPGFFTTDEGREADDEHSDWYGGDGRGWWEDEDDGGSSPLSNSQDSTQEGAFQAFFHMSADARRSLREGLKGRQIRAGRRRLQNNRAAFTVLTSANEKLSRFLQDSSQSELRLHPMLSEEKDQLVQLANLYSLQMRLEPTPNSSLTCPVLTKTRDTVRVEQISGLSRRLHPDASLKRRKLPPSSTSNTDIIDTTSNSSTRSLEQPMFHNSHLTPTTGCQSN